MRNRKIINITGWGLALVSTIAYILTMYPTLSFWDSGEYVATAATLQIGHAPGAPFYQIIGSFLAIFGFGNPVWIGKMVSLISPLAMGLSVMFLFWISVRILSRFSSAQPGIIISSAIAALSFAFLDSVWFSATEAEVYALSVLLSLIVFWLVLKWDSNSKKSYLLLATFLLGLSCSVHQLSLLILPAIIVVVYFHQRRTAYKGLIIYMALGLLALGALIWLSYWGVWAFLSLFSKPAIGVLIYCILALLALWFAKRFSKSWIEFSVLGLTFFFIGLSTYLIVPLRSSAGVPLNTMQPDSVERLRDYTNRENFLKPPLIYGQCYTALPPLGFVQKAEKAEPIFAKEQKMFFPRLWDYSSVASENGYVEWVGLPEANVVVDGVTQPKPTFWQNLRFLFSYQTSYMYFRYLLWNFCGRTNDAQGYGDYKNSQWNSGIKPLDDLFNVGTQDLNPQTSKAHNHYFAIPLLLCVIGMFYQARKDTKHFTVNASLFFFNSIALVLFLNMTAYQARERDYVYLLSFAAMTIWLAVGVLGISQWVANLLKVRKPRYVAWIFALVPALLFWQNLDDHDHSDQFTARNFAIDLLQSCEKNAILFTSGDNDTFPLWYIQNVEKIRQDVRVINLSLLNSLPQIDQLHSAQYSSPALKTNLTTKEYEDLFITSIYPSFDTLELNAAIKALPLCKTDTFVGLRLKHFPSHTFSLKKGDENIVWKLDNLEISRSQLACLDLIAKNIDTRPIYFSSYSVDDFLGLDKYLRLEGLAYRLDGKKVDKEEIIRQKAGTIDPERMYENLTRRFEWKNFNKEDIYYNETERTIAKHIIHSGVSLAYKLLESGEKEKALTVCNTLNEKMPFSQHYYPEAAADMAILYALLEQENKAERLITYAAGEFAARMEIHQNQNYSQQAQERPEVFQVMNQWLRLLIQAEEMNLEEIRIPLAERFFPIMNPYLTISFAHMERMSKKPEIYATELERMSNQIYEIYALAAAYEEAIITPPSDCATLLEDFEPYNY